MYVMTMTTMMVRTLDNKLDMMMKVMIALGLLMIVSLFEHVQAVDFTLVHDETLRKALHVAWKESLPMGESQCCLPKQYSMILTSSLTRKNSTSNHHLQLATTNSQTWFDGETKRKRIDSVNINSNGEPIHSSKYYFRLGSKDYEYQVLQGSCSCKIVKPLDWDQSCYPLNKNSLGKKHGEFEATHTFTNKYSQWTTKPNFRDNTCFPLSIELSHTQVTLSQNLYIPTANVDSTMFRLPPICPVFTSCK